MEDLKAVAIQSTSIVAGNCGIENLQALIDLLRTSLKLLNPITFSELTRTPIPVKRWRRFLAVPIWRVLRFLEWHGFKVDQMTRYVNRHPAGFKLASKGAPAHNPSRGAIQHTT